MAKARRYLLEAYATSVQAALAVDEEQPDQAGGDDGDALSPERAAEVAQQLRELDQARQRAEAGSRDYQIS